MRQANRRHRLGAGRTNTFRYLSGETFAVVGMYQIDNRTADQELFGCAQHLANGGALVSDDAIIVENGQDIAGIFHERTIELFARHSMRVARIVLRQSRRLSLVTGTNHVFFPHPAAIPTRIRTKRIRRSTDTMGICLRFS